MSTNRDNERLACGTAVADLLDRVADDLPVEAHHDTCPHCRATLAELGEVWAAVHRLAREPVAVPPAFAMSVRERIMARLGRVDMRRRAWVRLPALGRGATHLDEDALARLVRLAATSVPGVTIATAARSRLGVQVTSSDGHLEVAVAIQVPYGDDLIAVAAAVRLAVIVQLLAVAGLDDVAVDVAVTDLAG